MDVYSNRKILNFLDKVEAQIYNSRFVLVNTSTSATVKIFERLSVVLLAGIVK